MVVRLQKQKQKQNAVSGEAGEGDASNGAI